MLDEIGMEPSLFAFSIRKNIRTVQRWLSGARPIPGPVKACIHAWVLCHRNRIDYGPVAFIRPEHFAYGTQANG